jgi:hypothetical protein
MRLANRRLQPLGHLSGLKWDYNGIRHFQDSGLLISAPWTKIPQAFPAHLFRTSLLDGIECVLEAMHTPSAPAPGCIALPFEFSLQSAQSARLARVRPTEDLTSQGVSLDRAVVRKIGFSAWSHTITKLRLY